MKGLAMTEYFTQIACTPTPQDSIPGYMDPIGSKRHGDQMHGGTKIEVTGEVWEFFGGIGEIGFEEAFGGGSEEE